MASDDILSDILTQLGPMTAPLDEALALAIASAEDTCRELDSRFGYARSMMVRAFARIHLEKLGLAEGWELGGATNRMGQLIIRKPGIMDLRFLKGNPLQPGQVPQAGPGTARRAAWRQDPLPELWPASEPHTFLLLWDYLDISARTEGFTLRLVHPIGPGKFGYQVPCDLDIWIPRGGTMFEDLRFQPSEEDENFFAVEIDNEEELGK